MFETFDFLMEFRRAIVDECGDIVMWCDDMEMFEIFDFLAEYPEYSVRCIQIA